jgi:hypothetical protein
LQNPCAHPSSQFAQDNPARMAKRSLRRILPGPAESPVGTCACTSGAEQKRMDNETRAGALAWLATEAGRAALDAAAQLPPDRLTRLERLRRRYPATIAAVAVELLELRQRARRKFARADAMFFTPEGLEQSTGEAIARYRASRFPADIPILDACCGIGGDALALSERATVLAVDRNPAAAVCTGTNRALTPRPPLRSIRQEAKGRRQEQAHRSLAGGGRSGYSLYTLCADVTALDLARLRSAGVRSAFFDPSRRMDRPTGGRRRARSAEDYAPPLSWLDTLRAHFPFVAVKVSPAIDDAALNRYPAVEFISESGECKEATLWFGEAARTFAGASERVAPYLATVLRPGAPPETLTPLGGDPIEIAPPLAWLYEPDPAVIRAHLVPELAHRIGARLLDSQIAYLTSDTHTPSPFATAYRLREWLPFNLKNIQARLRSLGGRIVAVKKRGVPFEPDEIRKKLADAGDTPVVLVLTRSKETAIAILCETNAHLSSRS